MQKLAGHVVDEEGFELEVWISLLPWGEKEHVFVLYGGSQISDFPFQKPNKDSELDEATQMIAANPILQKLTLPLLIIED